MTKHESYAARKGYTLIKIQGRWEWWATANGSPMLYNLDTKRWTPAYCTVA